MDQQRREGVFVRDEVEVRGEGGEGEGGGRGRREEGTDRISEDHQRRDRWGRFVTSKLSTAIRRFISIRSFRRSSRTQRQREVISHVEEEGGREKRRERTWVATLAVYLNNSFEIGQHSIAIDEENQSTQGGDGRREADRFDVLCINP